MNLFLHKLPYALIVAVGLILAGCNKPANNDTTPLLTPGTSSDTNVNTATNSPTHHAEGIVNAVNQTENKITIAHGAIASLNWPAMIMSFDVQNQALLANIKPGQAVAFSFVEGPKRNYLITNIQAK